MKLKNEALQELYDTLTTCTLSCSPYAESPVDKAFEEVDRELTNLQNRNDILEKSNGTLLDANLDLCSKNRDLKNRLDKANADRTELQKDRDIWVRNNGEKQAEIAALKNQLDGALEAKKAVNNSRYKWAQKWLSTKQNLETKLNEAERKLDEVTSQYQKLTIENKRLQDDLREIGYKQGQTDLWDMLQNVNDTQPNEFDVECESMHDVIGMDLEDFLDAYKKWYEEKEIDRMRDYLERFCMGKLCISCPLHSYDWSCCGTWFRDMSAEDIKRYYEKARGCGRYTLNDGKLFATTVEGVNRAIAKACEGFCEAVRDADTKITENLRKGCTLEATVDVNKDLLNKVCGVKSEEEKPNPKELVITTRGVTTANYSEATMNAIKEAVRRFEKSLPALDSWESTITGSIKADDILGKTDDTEHKFEYGDAVRLPWRTYDYMYIGPEAKHIRLFDTKSHTVIYVSPSEKLTYQGCKIILTDEDDLRKIWKDKK